MRRSALACVVALVAAGCGDSTSPETVATVSVSPTSATMVMGATRQFTATVQDAAGTVLTGPPVTWNSSAQNVARVTGSGLVTAIEPGGARIAATSEGKSASAMVTVPMPEVTVSAVTPVTGTRSTADGLPRVSCDFVITASASWFPPDYSVGWIGAEELWTETSSGSRWGVGALHPADWFGSDRLTAGQTVTANRSYRWSGPFTVALSLRYEGPYRAWGTDQDRRAAAILLTCL